ncbi:MAG: DUF1295 domain-containing protein [Chloroflexota bacterium]
MKKKMHWPYTLLTLLALAIVYGIGSTFFTIELERMVERAITPQIAASAQVSELSHEIYAGVDHFMAARHVRLVGYFCIALIVLAAFVGLLTQKRWLASLGSLGLILPVYAHFILHMSFLAGLGVLTALWAPFWGDLVRLGDIAYLPYMAVVYPCALAGWDVRRALAGLCASLGLLIFILGVLAWFYARYQKKNTADFWLYRFTRHPQYLGWIVWSYGLMLRVALRQDAALQEINPGASLPWVISTLIILCVALSEEISMRRQYPVDYEQYCKHTPFMLPLPGFLCRMISAPFRLVRKKDQLENRLDLVWVFAIYLAVIVLLSAPFVFLDWPDSGSWVKWPF